MKRFLAAKFLDDMPKRSFGGLTPVAGTFLPRMAPGVAIRINARRPQQQQQAQGARRTPSRRQAG